MKISDAVKRKAKQYACNTIEFVGYKNGSPVFSLSSVDEDGMPIPTGLPLLIVDNGNSLEEITGLEVFSFLDTLQQA